MTDFTAPLFLYLFFPSAVIFLVWLAAVFLRMRLKPKRSYGSRYPLIGRSKLWGLFVLPAVVFMIFALARPIVPGSNVRLASGDIEVIVLLDNSISMRADDIRPSRLEIAKREISNLGPLIREGDKVAFFIFGKSSSRKLYLTKDVETFFDQVGRVNFPAKLSDDESIWSTAFATALEHIYQSLDRQDAYNDGYPAGKKYNPQKRANRIVVVFSDGEDQILDSLPIGEQAVEQKADYVKKLRNVLDEYKKRGLKIYPVGVGTARGSDWLYLLRGYKKDSDYPGSLEEEWRGQVSRLDKINLQELARLTGVQLAGHDWTVESYQDRSGVYLKNVIDSNRQASVELTVEENADDLWQYCLLVSAVFLALGIVTCPFKGYLRKD